MVSSSESFKAQGYLYVPAVLTKEQCEYIVNRIWNLQKLGKFQYDSQCPISEAFYSDIEFDKLLITLAARFSEITGYKLWPTFSYARIYRPGETLKWHYDRPSCEISSTVTLEYDADSNWPIYFGNALNRDSKSEKEWEEYKKHMKDLTDENGVSSDKSGVPYTIEPGDGMMYMGEIRPHWREKFTGKWHIQIFFHYIDSNGKYRHLKLDGRSKPGEKK